MPLLILKIKPITQPTRLRRSFHGIGKVLRGHVHAADKPRQLGILPGFRPTERMLEKLTTETLLAIGFADEQVQQVRDPRRMQRAVH